MSYRSELIQCAAVCVAALSNLDNGNTELHNDGFIYEEIQAERAKQEQKWGVQNRTPEKWMVILGEEFGEACKDILENNLT